MDRVKNAKPTPLPNMEPIRKFNVLFDPDMRERQAAMRTARNK